MQDTVWIVLIILAALLAMKVVKGILKGILFILILAGIALLIFNFVGDGLKLSKERSEGEWDRMLSQVPVYQEVSDWIEDQWLKFNIRWR